MSLTDRGLELNYEAHAARGVASDVVHRDREPASAQNCGKTQIRSVFIRENLRQNLSLKTFIFLRKNTGPPIMEMW
jgi:hypothetical protein